MTTAADDSADEIAFEAFLAGRPVPAEADDGFPAVTAFAGAVRATATLPGRPNAALAELLATGLLTDQSSPSIRTAPSAGRSPRRSRIRRRRFAMFFPALLAKFLAAGAIAQAATGAGVAVVVVTAAGATGVLGDGVQNTISSVVSTNSDEVTTQDDAALTGDGTTTTDPGVVDSTKGETALPVEAAFNAQAWKDAGPAGYKTFGEWVSDGAHNKDALEAAAALAGDENFRFGQIVSQWATKKHMSAEDLAEEGVDLDELTEGDTEPAPVVESETDDAGTQAATTERGHGGTGGTSDKAGGNSGNAGGNSGSNGHGRGHN
jgi:hypothetical protein